MRDLRNPVVFGRTLLQAQLLENFRGAVSLVAVPGIHYFAVAADDIGHRHGAHPAKRLILRHGLVSRGGGVEDVGEGHLVSFEIIQRDLAVVGWVEAQDD